MAMRQSIVSRLQRIEERFGSRAEPKAIVLSLVSPDGTVSKQFISWVGGAPPDAGEREKEILAESRLKRKASGQIRAGPSSERWATLGQISADEGR